MRKIAKPKLSSAVEPTYCVLRKRWLPEPSSSKCHHLDRALFRCRLYTCQSKQYSSTLMEQNLCSIYKSTNATEFDNKSAEHKAKSI